MPAMGISKSGTKSYMVYSMKGVLSSGSTLLQKYYLFGYFTASETKGEDHETELKVWSSGAQ